MNLKLDREYKSFLEDIKKRVRASQYEALKAVNRELIALYWDIGKRIVEKQKKLGWGKAIVETLAKDLQKEFPGIRGFSSQNLWYMRQFFGEYHESSFLQPLVGEISWTKHLVIMSQCKEETDSFELLEFSKKTGLNNARLIGRFQVPYFTDYIWAGDIN